MSIETIFAAAVEKTDPKDRAAYLAEACGENGELREQVNKLLDAHERAGSFLHKPAVDPMPEVTRSYDDDRTVDDDQDDVLAMLKPSDRPDSLGRIDHYEVQEVLGRGGFGIVFRAFDDVLQRIVAVKVLAPSLATTSPARKRFLREARSSAQVRHENVVQVHAVEEQPLPYLVMEFVPGETLQQKIDRTGPLEILDVLRIGRQIAAGLTAAHATGLIHRDIKPSNILIERSADERVKITDFGLARAADDASMTRSGVVAGTPMYMAPEQARGDTLDHRADLFSLGSVLYVMCTGRPPFRASSTLAVLKRVAEDQPRPIREIIPEVPEWFCRIVEKLHAKKPEERFQTANEVADVLADCGKQLAEQNAVTDFTRIPVDSARSERRRPKQWVALLVLIVFVGIAIGAAFFAVDRYLRNAEPVELRIKRDKIAARERERDEQLARFQAEKATPAPVLAAQSALTEARIELAEAQGDTVAVRSLLAELVKWRRDERQYAQLRVQAKLETPESVAKFDAQVADAEARLVNAGGTPPPSPLTPDNYRLATGPTSLIPLARPGESQGRWMVDEGKLVHPVRPFVQWPPAIPIAIRAPDEFDLDAEFERTAGQDFIGFGMSAQGRRFQVALDSWREWAGVQDVAGELLDRNPTRRKGPWLTNGRRHVFRCEVRASGVQAWLDGKEAVNYRGGFEVLAARPPGLADGVQFYVQANEDCGFVVHKLVLTPRTGTPADGFEPLFKGNALTGWTTVGGTPATWKMEEGTLRATGSKSLLVGTPSYRNFVLRGELRMSAGGEWGVLCRTDSKNINGPNPPSGLALTCSYGGAVGDVDGQIQMNCRLSLNGIPLTQMGAMVKPHEWFPIEVTLRGRDINVRVKGGSLGATKVPDELPEGPLAFVLPNPNATLECRNMEIRPLVDAEPILKKDQPASNAPKFTAKSDFVPLFKGDDLTDWKRFGGTPATWLLDQGVLRATGAKSDLVGSNRYKNFVLRSEIRMSVGGEWNVLLPSDPNAPKGNATPQGLSISCKYSGNAHDVAGHIWMTVELKINGKTLSTSGSNVKPHEWFPIEITRKDRDIFVAIKEGSLGVAPIPIDLPECPIAFQLVQPQATLECRKMEIRPLAPVDPSLAKPLNELIAAREKARDEQKKRFDAQVIPKTDVIEAEIDLCETRLKLAEAEFNQAIRHKLLNQIDTFLKEKRRLIEQKVKAGVSPVADLNAIDTRIAEVQIRLAKIGRE